MTLNLKRSKTDQNNRFTDIGSNDLGSKSIGSNDKGSNDIGSNDIGSNNKRSNEKRVKNATKGQKEKNMLYSRSFDTMSVNRKTM